MCIAKKSIVWSNCHISFSKICSIYFTIFVIITTHSLSVSPLISILSSILHSSSFSTLRCIISSPAICLIFQLLPIWKRRAITLRAFLIRRWRIESRDLTVTHTHVTAFFFSLHPPRRTLLIRLMPRPAVLHLFWSGLLYISSSRILDRGLSNTSGIIYLVRLNERVLYLSISPGHVC